jgi:hypothetical protein
MIRLEACRRHGLSLGALAIGGPPDTGPQSHRLIASVIGLPSLEVKV